MKSTKDDAEGRLRQFAQEVAQLRRSLHQHVDARFASDLAHLAVAQTPRRIATQQFCGPLHA